MKTRDAMKTLAAGAIFQSIQAVLLNQENISENTVNQVTEPIKQFLENLIDETNDTALNSKQIDKTLQDLIAAFLKDTLKNELFSNQEEENEFHDATVAAICAAISARKKSAEIIEKLRAAMIGMNISQRTIDIALKTISDCFSEQPVEQVLNNNANAEKATLKIDAPFKKLFGAFLKSLISEKLSLSNDTMEIIEKAINSAFAAPSDSGKKYSFADNLSTNQKKAIVNGLVVFAATLIGWAVDFFSSLFAREGVSALKWTMMKKAGGVIASLYGDYLYNSYVQPVKTAAQKIGSFFTGLFSGGKKEEVNTDINMSATSSVSSSDKQINDMLFANQGQSSVKAEAMVNEASPKVGVSSSASAHRQSNSSMWSGLASYASSFFVSSNQAPTQAPVVEPVTPAATM